MDANLFLLSKWKKRVVVFTSDTAMVFCSLFIAYGILGYSFKALSMTHVMTLTSVQCAIFLVCGLYRGIWRFASIPDLMRMGKAVLLGTGSFFCFNFIFMPIFTIKVATLYALLLMSLLSGSRLLVRWFREYRYKSQYHKRAMIVGAGSAGEVMIRDLLRLPTKKYCPTIIVDDDINKKGSEIHGIRVVGETKEIPYFVNRYDIDLILIAIPSLSSNRMREIVKYCEQAQVPFRTLPSLKDLADGSVSINAIREVLLEDLLGREPVEIDWKKIQGYLEEKHVLITGGGGSIGSELCRQICRLSPAKLIIVDNNEFNLYSIHLELKEKFPQLLLICHLCSVTDKIELEKIFQKDTPDIVFHAAAYKHVPLLEDHFRVAMYNNVVGTKYVAELADQYGVETFVLISTDKAVNPTNVMGATKRAAEIYCQNYHFHSTTRFITVRFGNVLASNGSVVPLFRQQLLKGGPLTVTHPEITRFFMTIKEAVQLILQACVLNESGHIFVLDMGEPIKIRYLAEQMIQLSGKASTEIDIVYTGLRPGEKLDEELFHPLEAAYATAHPKIKQGQVRQFNWKDLCHYLTQIEQYCQSGYVNELKKVLEILVPEYNQNHSTSDGFVHSLKHQELPAYEV